MPVPSSYPALVQGTLAAENLSTGPHSQYHADDRAAVKAILDGEVLQYSQPYLRIASSTSHANFNADYRCDGTNDHVEIAAALAVCNLAGGGVVQLSPGQFNVLADQIAVPNDTTLRGCGSAANGAGATVIANSGSSTGKLIRSIGTAGDNRLNGVRVENLAIDGNSADVTGIWFQYNNVWHIDRVAIFDCTRYGFYGLGVSDSSFTRSRIDWCGSNGQTGTNCRGAFTLDTEVAGWGCDNVQIWSTKWENNPDRAIHVTRGTGSVNPYEITFDSCKVEVHPESVGADEGAANDYVIFDRTSHCRFVNNYCYSSQNEPGNTPWGSFLLLNSVQSMWVKGNTFSSNYASTDTDPFTSWIETSGTNTGVWLTENCFQHGSTGVPTNCILWAGTDNSVGPGRVNYIQGTSTTLESGTADTHIMPLGGTFP